MPAILPNWFKVSAIIVGAFTGVLLFYFLPWLYCICCVLGLYAGLYKAIDDSVREPLITLSKSVKVFLVITGTISVVLFHYYLPWIGWWVIASVVMCVITESRSVKSVEVFSETTTMVIGVVMVFSLMLLQFYVAEINAAIVSRIITSSRQKKF